MNALPEHRRAINGRTFSEVWNRQRGDFDDERTTCEDLGHATATLLCCVLLVGFVVYMALNWGA